MRDQLPTTETLQIKILEETDARQNREEAGACHLFLTNRIFCEIYLCGDAMRYELGQHIYIYLSI